jgi:hypothetical protein
MTMVALGDRVTQVLTINPRIPGDMETHLFDNKKRAA